MNINKKVIEYARALKEYCSDTECEDCLFTNLDDPTLEFGCELTEDAPPAFWELDDIKESDTIE